MPLFKVDAIVRATNGDIEVLRAYHFQAYTYADAEKVADNWVKVRGFDNPAARVRIVQGDLIRSERMVGETGWTWS